MEDNEGGQNLIIKDSRRLHGPKHDRRSLHRYFVSQPKGTLNIIFTRNAFISVCLIKLKNKIIEISSSYPTKTLHVSPFNWEMTPPLPLSSFRRDF